MESPFRKWLPCLPLAREKLFVLRHQGRWKVKHDGILLGPYVGQDWAVRAAIEEAQKVGRQGGQGAQVFVQVTHDEYKLAWTYGLDPYPAPADFS